jgi:hypothetical protein
MDGVTNGFTDGLFGAELDETFVTFWPKKPPLLDESREGLLEEEFIETSGRLGVGRLRRLPLVEGLMDGMTGGLVNESLSEEFVETFVGPVADRPKKPPLLNGLMDGLTGGGMGGGFAGGVDRPDAERSVIPLLSSRLAGSGFLDGIIGPAVEIPDGPVPGKLSLASGLTGTVLGSGCGLEEATSAAVCVFRGNVAC